MVGQRGDMRPSMPRRRSKRRRTGWWQIILLNLVAEPRQLEPNNGNELISLAQQEPGLWVRPLAKEVWEK